MVRNDEVAAARSFGGDRGTGEEAWLDSGGPQRKLTIVRQFAGKYELTLLSAIDLVRDKSRKDLAEMVVAAGRRPELESLQRSPDAPSATSSPDRPSLNEITAAEFATLSSPALSQVSPHPPPGWERPMRKGRPPQEQL